MTPWRRLYTLAWKAVCASAAGQLEEYFRSTRASYVLIVEEVMPFGSHVRGLISRRRVEREMGRMV